MCNSGALSLPAASSSLRSPGCVFCRFSLLGFVFWFPLLHLAPPICLFLRRIVATYPLRRLSCPLRSRIYVLERRPFFPDGCLFRLTDECDLPVASFRFRFFRVGACCVIPAPCPCQRRLPRFVLQVAFFAGFRCFLSFSGFCCRRVPPRFVSLLYFQGRASFCRNASLRSPVLRFL